MLHLILIARFFFHCVQHLMQNSPPNCQNLLTVYFINCTDMEQQQIHQTLIKTDETNLTAVYQTKSTGCLCDQICKFGK